MKNSKENHQICINALVKSGFAKVSKDLVRYNNIDYIVRAHRMPMTRKGLAIIADIYELVDGVSENVIFIDPNRYNNNIYLVNKSSLISFIRENGNTNSIMWMTDKNDDPDNMGKSSCMTIPIISIINTDWVKVMNL